MQMIKMTVPRTVCLGFLAVITLGTLLLMMPFCRTDGTWSDPITALFTSTSAVCVTGLSVVDVGKYYSFWGQFVLVLLVQIGGLGYMTATTFLLLLLGRKFGLRDRIALQQTLDRTGLEGVVQLVKSIIALTLIIEISGVFLLQFVFIPDYGWTPLSIWMGIFHSINSFNNAGFSLFSDSFIGYSQSIILNLVVTALIILGGIGYEVMMEAFLWTRDRLQRKVVKNIFSLNFKIVTTTTIFLLALGTLLFFVIEYQNPGTLGPMDFGHKVLAAWFQSVTPRTAGFNTVDYGKMTKAGLFITIVLMFVGASPGSTGGGIKTTTSRLLFSALRSVLQGKETVDCYERQISFGLILKAIGVAIGSLMVVIISTVLISISDTKFEFIQVIFEVVSAFATVGLSTGITAVLSPFAKLVIITTMYLGRVGVLLLILAIIGDPKPTKVQYPEENLLVG